jgi:hypothetical protein
MFDEECAHGVNPNCTQRAVVLSTASDTTNVRPRGRPPERPGRRDARGDDARDRRRCPCAATARSSADAAARGTTDARARVGRAPAVPGRGGLSLRRARLTPVTQVHGEMSAMSCPAPRSRSRSRSRGRSRSSTMVAMARGEAQPRAGPAPVVPGRGGISLRKATRLPTEERQGARFRTLAFATPEGEAQPPCPARSRTARR